MDSPSTVLSANEDKHPALLYSIPEGGEKKEEVRDTPWSIDPFKPKRKGKSKFVNWDDYGDYEEEDEDGEEKEEVKMAGPAPAPVEQKKDADFDFSFDNSKKDKKKNRQAVFSWDESEAKAEESPEPLAASQDRESTKAVGFGTWGTSWDWDTTTNKKAKKSIEEPDSPADAISSDENWSIGVSKQDKKKKKSTSWGDESIDSERQPSVIKAEDEDESEDAPPATNQTRRPLQEVESPRPEEETTGPPARRQSL
ncbi:hypothetical protein LQW54_011572 [Pestalotiopsis sp. IQ-011]